MGIGMGLKVKQPSSRVSRGKITDNRPGINRAYFRSRKLSRTHPWRSRHELADVDSVWNSSRNGSQSGS